MCVAIKGNFRRLSEIEGYSKAFSKLFVRPKGKFRRF